MSQYPQRSRTEWITRMLAWNPRLPLLLATSVVMLIVTVGTLLSGEAVLFFVAAITLSWIGALAMKDLQAFLRHELHYRPDRTVAKGDAGVDVPVDPIAELLEEIEFKVTRLKDIREKHGDAVADKCEELLRQSEFLGSSEESP